VHSKLTGIFGILMTLHHIIWGGQSTLDLSGWCVMTIPLSTMQCQLASPYQTHMDLLSARPYMVALPSLDAIYRVYAHNEAIRIMGIPWTLWLKKDLSCSLALSNLTFHLRHGYDLSMGQESSTNFNYNFGIISAVVPLHWKDKAKI